ncbi:MAG TPA: PASTA domain-containing protein [Saprospiraceae bacterium]|nr:PASTA domain-containing protein [Saprospiraceae bacterium]HRO09498.1 PASTA domain-containing protein [Saprospiraceae bacterium]HRO73943.1 PASTA domain-containing protein [Saprospiraceae bacterium]HRP42776.1 PASTA domain-containing protein [Saprospiraceae bacterium]
MSGTNESDSFWSYLKSKTFVRHILLILSVFVVLLLLIQWSLRIYTHHGQKLELPDFIGKSLTDAEGLSELHDFQIVVSDSIFIIGKKGGIVTDQNPKPGSMVKENRKIYVTVTKFIKETVRVADLPTLYGNAFEQKKTELKYRDIDCVVKSYAYDPGEPNHILEVYYNGQLIVSKDGRMDNVVIEKGSVLECVVSRRDGGDVTIPNLRCKDLDEARFILESSKLQLGDIVNKGDESGVLYIIAQSPPYDGISNIKMGDKVSVTVTGSKPVDCN